MTREGPRDTWKTAVRGGVVLFALGLVGVVALAATVAPTLEGTPGLESFSYPVLVVIAAANSTFLLAITVALGTYAAPRLGLQSLVYTWATRGSVDWSGFRASLPLSVGLGATLFVVVAVLDVALSPFVAVATGPAPSDAETLRALATSVPLRLLYGGITEELLLRWGVMAPIAWALWRGRVRFGRAAAHPSSTTMWVAVVGSAVLFGVGHLPALATSFGLTGPLVARTVLLNAVVGVGLGWLFWRRSLEAAMVAHGSFHVALLVSSTFLVLVA